MTIVAAEGKRGTALFLAAHPPGRGTGSAVRNRIVLDTLRSLFESVDAVALANPGEAALADSTALLIPRPASLSRLRTVASIPRGGVLFAPELSARLGERLGAMVDARSLRSEYDVVWAHHSLMAGAAADSVRAPVRVLDVDTVAEPVIRAAATGVRRRSRRLYGLVHAKAAGWEERRRWSRFEHLVVSSQLERQRLGRLGDRATVVPNAVPAPLPSGAPQPSEILFVGSLDYGPNIDAARSLLESILPRIRSRRGATTVLIAGRDPGKELTRRCHEAAVRLLPSPASLDPAYAGARIFAAPLAYGGGTKIKMIEAMAHGLPIVASSVAAEGLEVRHQENALIHDTPDEFADACVMLLRDRRLADLLGAAAHDTWMRHHRPEAVQRSIGALLEQLRRTEPV